jgi:hypothetical protein
MFDDSYPPSPLQQNALNPLMRSHPSSHFLSSRVDIESVTVSSPLQRPVGHGAMSASMEQLVAPRSPLSSHFLSSRVDIESVTVSLPLRRPVGHGAMSASMEQLVAPQVQTADFLSNVVTNFALTALDNIQVVPKGRSSRMKLKGKPCSEIVAVADDVTNCQAECGPSPSPPGPEIITVDDAPDCQAECGPSPPPPCPEIITVDDAPDCQAECGPSPPPPCPEIIAAMDTNDDQDTGEPSNSSSQKGPHTSEQLWLLAF